MFFRFSFKTDNMKSLPFAFILFLLFLLSCSKHKRFDVDLNEINIELSFNRFDIDFGKNDTSNTKASILKLNEAYPEFFCLFTNRIIQIGSSRNSGFISNLNQFKSDSVYCQVFDSVQAHPYNFTALNQTIEDGFKRFSYFFPNRPIPNIYYHISGFNESVVVAPKILAISIDNYLGSDHTFYKWLALYEYLRNNMYPEKIPTDALWAWLSTEFEPNDISGNLLTKMINDGRILFALKQLLPDEPLHRIHSYTPKQMAWCLANEKGAWSYIIEYKHLFTKDLVTIKKYTSAGPFTHFFGTESSPRIGSYIGYRIVEQFMENNEDVSLNTLMQIKDAQIILEKSAYRP